MWSKKNYSNLRLASSKKSLTKYLSQFGDLEIQLISSNIKKISEYEKKIYGGDKLTTNNRMELLAAIEALGSLKESSNVILTTDSEYVRQGITTWMPNWKKRGWKTANKKPVKNIDLWQRLEKASNDHLINWKWIKGHSGHRENEIADQLANQGIDEMKI